MMIPLIPLCFYPVKNHIRSRLSVLIPKIILSFFGVITFFAFYSCIFSYLNSFYVILLSGVFFFWLYHREILLPFLQKLFIFFTVCLVGTFSLLFATTVDYTLHPASHYQNFSVEALISQVLFLLFMNLVLYVPFTRYLSWLVDSFQVKRVWMIICFFPLLSMPALYTMVPHNYRLMQIGRIREIYLIISAFLLFHSLLVYFLFYNIAYTYVQKQETEYHNQLLSIQGNQYQQLLRTVQENSRIRHDFRHQLIVISELLNQKEYDKLKEYLQEYVDNTQSEFRLYSYSAAINALLSYYKSVCQNRSIQTDFSLGLPDKLPVSDQDFCVMLGNLLENAIYGCQGSENPYIHLKIHQTSPNILAVRITNPYQGNLKKSDEQYLSSRHSGPGQGLDSINVIVEKYEGVMEIQTEQQIFTVKILLQIPVKDIQTGTDMEGIL